MPGSFDPVDYVLLWLVTVASSIVGSGLFWYLL